MLGGMEEDVVGFPGRGLGVVRGGLGNGEPVMADDIALDSVEAFLGHSTRSKSKDFADDMNNATDSPESSAKKAEEPETICRVCHMEGTEGNPLYSPCNCRGSIEYVHQDCLQRWLAHKNLTKCEVCNWTFQYKSIYAEGAPESPRTVDLLFWIVKKCALLIPLLFNIVLAVCLFFFLMPLLTCWMYRVCFLSSPLEIPAALYQYSSQSVVKIWTDSQIGVLICAAIIFVSMIIASLREFLRDNVEAGRPEEADGDIPFVLQPDDERNGNAEDQPVEDDDLFGHWFGLVEHPLSVAISIFLFNMVFLACAILVPLSLGRLVFAAADVLFPTLFAASTVQTLPDVLLEAQMDTNASKNGVSSIVEATYVQIYSYFYNASMLTSPTIDSMGSFNSTNISSSAGLANSALNNTVVDNGLGSAYGVRDSSILLAGYLALVVMVLLWSALTQLVAGGRVPVEATIDTTVTYAVTGIKVCTVTSLELIAFPIMMGWSVDILTLDLVGGTWEVRKIFFKLAPFTCLVVHWFIGFIFMISVSFFASLLRKIIRKNVLAKILRYPDDPDFQPFRELVTIPFFTHIRRVLVSAVVYNVLAVLCCHIPAKFYIWLFSSLVPLHVRFSDPTEVPVDLILFHFCAPFAFERFDLKDLSLQGLKSWFYHVSRLLGLVEYLLIPERGNRDDGDDQGHEAGDPVGGDDHLAVDDDGQQDRDAEIENDSESEAQLPENAEAVEASESVMGTKEKSISMEVEDDLDELVPRQRSQEPTDIHIKPRLCEEKESGDSGERTESEDEEESKMPAIVTEMGALRNEASQEILDGEGDGKLASLYLDDDDDNLASLYKTNDSEKHDGSPQVSSLAENNNSESDGHGVDTVDVDGQEMTPQELMEMLDRLEALDRANEEASDSVSSQGINHFQLRVFVLLLLLWFTDVVCIGVSMLVPLFTGRFLMQRAHKNPHDLYALLAGFYFYFLLCLVVVQTYRYLRQRNLKQIVQTSLTWLVIGFKCSFLGCFLAGVLPLLVGVIFDLSFVVPIRFPLDEEPQLFLYQDWALGLVFLKIWVRLLLAGVFGESQWKERVERVVEDGVRGVRLRFVLYEIVLPMLANLVFLVSVPYVISTGLYPLLPSLHLVLPSMLDSPLLVAALKFTGIIDDTATEEEQVVVADNLLFRFSFLALLILRLVSYLVEYSLTWFRWLERQTFEERWVVGKRLINARDSGENKDVVGNFRPRRDQVKEAGSGSEIPGEADGRPEEDDSNHQPASHRDDSSPTLPWAKIQPIVTTEAAEDNLQHQRLEAVGSEAVKTPSVDAISTNY